MKVQAKSRQQKTGSPTIVVWKKGAAHQGRAQAGWLRASRPQEALLWFRPAAKS